MYRVWKELGKVPTKRQYEIGNLLQTGSDRMMLEAFRGIGKSMIVAVYVLSLLKDNPNLKVMVVSASGSRAVDMTTWMLQLTGLIPEFRVLAPKDSQRQRMDKFDVGSLSIEGVEQSPSVKSIGIKGQLSGSRAHIIIADDVEIPSNSATEVQRNKLKELIKEFEAILLPGGRIIYLGTPQTEGSIYPWLEQATAGLGSDGYQTCIIPARYPDQELREFYGSRLSPEIIKELEEDPTLVGKPTEPTRFSEEELTRRTATYGKSGFALQFMLDTRLSNRMRCPLRLSDLMVMHLNTECGPQKPVWGAGADYILSDLPSVGLQGDYLYRPWQVVGDPIPYTGSIMVIDPSGRGSNETAWVVLKYLNGYLYILDAGGRRDGYSDETLGTLVSVAKKHGIKTLVIEPNYGDGMFQRIVQTHFDRVCPVHIEEAPRSSGLKEQRVIDTLEPIMNQHRLVVDHDLVRRDFEESQGRDEDDQGRTWCSLFMQMTRLTKERGSIPLDDRIDALAIGVRYFVDQMSKDADKSIQKHEQQQKEKLAKDFIRSYQLNHGIKPESGPKWAKILVTTKSIV